MADSPFSRFLEGAGSAALALLHPELATVDIGPDPERLQLPAPEPVAGTPRPIALACPDLAALRAVRVPAELRTRRLAVWLLAGTPLGYLPDPGHPRLEAIRSRTEGAGSFTVLRFAGPVVAAEVIARLARQAAWGDRDGNHGVWLDTDPEVGAGAEAQVPADLVVTAARPDLEIAAVTGRRPRWVDPVGGPVELGPVDERVVNPIGCRPGPGATIEWSVERDPRQAREVVERAMRGEALRSGALPGWAEQLLGQELRAALLAPYDDADELAVQEHSVVLRRAALTGFSRFGWRQRLAAAGGLPVPQEPTVSIVLATRREEMLDFALGQVAKQRAAGLELVLAPHGFTVDPVRVRDRLPAQIELTVRPYPADALFGEVLHGAAGAASGDLLLKFDDDDWYSPDAVTDLLLARRFSGAEVVGMPAEFHYLAEVDTTVRRGHRDEVYTRFVAGGTMMIARDLLRCVGGFRPVRKYVDAQLLHAVHAVGGVSYRTHGLGYLLRRNPSGHTWQVGLDYLLAPERTAASWPGFRPSRLLECARGEYPSVRPA